MNLVLGLFFLLLTTILGVGIPYNVCLQWMPKFVQQVFPYGKTSKGLVTTPWIKSILVPKRWFTHFYLFAMMYTLLITSVMFMTYGFNKDVPEIFENYVHMVSYHSHESIGDSISSLLAASLFLLHVTRRWYECMFVSIFSSASMNLAHYASGYLHYWGCATVLVAYSRVSYQPEFGPLVLMQLLLGVLLFIYASYQQYSVHKSFANSRKKSSNNEKYVMPKGGLFEYISCPNYFCEILIYISIYLILGFGHYAWALILMWVISNQMMAASMTHNWYREHFKNYPKLRRAIIPFLF